VHDPLQTQPTDLAMPKKWPAPRRRTGRRRTMPDRPTATRCLTATRAHAVATGHMAAAACPESNETGRRHSPADGQHQQVGRSAAAHDEVHPLPDYRETGR
jgi:hypothetical protein